VALDVDAGIPIHPVFRRHRELLDIAQDAEELLAIEINDCVDRVNCVDLQLFCPRRLLHVSTSKLICGPVKPLPVVRERPPPSGPVLGIIPSGRTPAQ
jgi:hypothetical protein